MRTRTVWHVENILSTIEVLGLHPSYILRTVHIFQCIRRWLCINIQMYTAVSGGICSALNIDIVLHIRLLYNIYLPHKLQ